MVPRLRCDGGISARADDLSVVGVAPRFEVLSLRMTLFLVPTFFLIFSMCALYDNVLSSVTPRYTGSVQKVKVTLFQLMLRNGSSAARDGYGFR